MNRLLLCSIVALFLVSCNNSLEFKEKNFQKEAEGCDDRCVVFDLSYLEAEGGKSKDFVSNYNTTMKNHIASYIISSYDFVATMKEYGINPNDFTLDQIADAYIKKTESSYFDDILYNHEFVMLDSLLFHNEDFTSVKRAWQAYTGGAHGSETVEYYNFDANGKELSRESLFKDSLSVMKVSEKYFRKQTNMTPNESFDEAGFWFDNGLFLLSQNIGFTQTDMILYYNPYEIAPYSSGPTEIKVPLSDVLKWVRDELTKTKK